MATPCFVTAVGGAARTAATANRGKLTWRRTQLAGAVTWCDRRDCVASVMPDVRVAPPDLPIVDRNAEFFSRF
jgi:hypothetical protein